MKAEQLKTFRWFQTDDQVKCIVTLSSFIWLLYQHHNGYTALGDWDTHFFCDWDRSVKKHGCHLQQGWVLAGKSPYNSLNICPIIINGDTCIRISGYTCFQLDLQGAPQIPKMCMSKLNGQNYASSGVHAQGSQWMCPIFILTHNSRFLWPIQNIHTKFCSKWMKGDKLMIKILVSCRSTGFYTVRLVKGSKAVTHVVHKNTVTICL